MCLLIFAHQVSPQYPLIVAANRDEFHARPTAASAFWPDFPHLLAGKDLQQGGTWMGITRDGRFAAITNYRDAADTTAGTRSRGELPLGYLSSDGQPDSFLHDVAKRADQYSGFNLLLGDRDSLWYYSNSSSQDKPSPQRLEPGIYGLSNAQLDTPWPKVATGKSRLQELLSEGVINHDILGTAVDQRQLASTSELQDQGQEGEMGRVLSAQFIVTETYGTRSSTTLWTDLSGRAHWRERSYDATGNLSSTQQQAFELN